MNAYDEERESMWNEYHGRSELQTAYDVSMMEHEDDRGLIADELDKGRFVVQGLGTAYCPRTDAIMGSHYFMLSSHETHEEALEAMKEYERRFGGFDGEATVTIRVPDDESFASQFFRSNEIRWDSLQSM